MNQSLRTEGERLEGAEALYRTCREFVDDLNGRLPEPILVLDPPEWNREGFNEAGPNLLQISLRGRLLQIEYEATNEPNCTEDFRHPYILQGGVRSFNQDFLDRDRVDEQRIFYCPSKSGARWHFFDARTYRTGQVNLDYLASELERLL